MQIFQQIAPLKAFLQDQRCRDKSIGLVPTMGALHAGHIALFKHCKTSNDLTVGSIFVNPAQFNNANDLLKYPRNLESDIEQLETAGCDVLFTPSDTEMYPETASMSLDFGTLDKVMEGKFRPGHFSGVALIVSKLFNIVQPHNAYFGQKDWQQFAIIRKLIQDLNFDVALHSVATLREEDGLALSSRNQRLTPEQRLKANRFYKGLLAGKTALMEGLNVDQTRIKVRETVETFPDVRLEYFELADSKNLSLLKNVDHSGTPIMCIAGYVGDIRLIDNMFVD